MDAGINVGRRSAMVLSIEPRIPFALCHQVEVQFGHYFVKHLGLSTGAIDYELNVKHPIDRAAHSCDGHRGDDAWNSVAANGALRVYSVADFLDSGFR